MEVLSHSQPRIHGNTAVLSRLERLGRAPRTFANLVQAGFPAAQLADAGRWFLKAAGTPVEVYAGQRMAQGFFEDESLLPLLCHQFECTDWKLKNSGWFFSAEDYQRFNEALVAPVAFRSAQLARGEAEERWGSYFMRLPFDLGMDQAKHALWDGLAQQDHYWKPQESYAHLRADAMYGYLRRTVDILKFTPSRFNYRWEQDFRERFQAVLLDFQENLEKAVRQWNDKRQEHRRRRFRYRNFPRNPTRFVPEQKIKLAFAALGLEQGTATLTDLSKAFRRLSLGAHPDQGGTPEAFQRLSRHKELAEDWLRRRS